MTVKVCQIRNETKCYDGNNRVKLPIASDAFLLCRCRVHGFYSRMVIKCPVMVLLLSESNVRTKGNVQYLTAPPFKLISI